MKPTPEPRNREERFAQMRANLNNVFTRPQHRRQIEEDLFRARQGTLAVNGEHRVPYDQSWKDAAAKYVTSDIKFWRAQMKAFRSCDARDLGSTSESSTPFAKHRLKWRTCTLSSTRTTKKYVYPLEEFYHQRIP